MLARYHKNLKENYLKRKNDIYYSLESNDNSTADEDIFKSSKEKKLKKIDEINKNEQNSINPNEQTNFRRYVLYSHENRGLIHDEKENVEGGIGKSEKDTKNNESGEDEQSMTGYLEAAAKYFRNCIMLLKSKYKAETIGFFENKYEIKIEKNEIKGSGEESKEVEFNKFSEKFEKFFIFILFNLF